MSYVKRIISGLCSLAMISSYAQVFDFNVWAEDSVIDTEVETETIPEESEGIKYGDINRDSKIDETDCTELSKAINNKTASELLNADLNSDGKVNNADALVLNQYVTGEIKYFSVGEYYLEDVSFVTRGEWIHNLVETYDMSVEDESSIVEYYTDIAENQYASDINLAANFGVFEVESDKFNPDSLVTREFAAHTANFCAGYLNEITVKFADTDDIYYEDDAVVSIEHGWFECIDEEFRPMMYMKSTEAEVILSDLIGSNEEIVIDEDAENVIEYSEDVITIDSNVDVTKLENTVVINDENISIMPGNIFMVTIDDSQFIYKAKAVSMNSNGAVVVEIEDVSIEEAVDSIDIQGYGEVDYDNITYYGEEVSTEIDPEEAVNTFNSSALKNDSQSKRFELSRKFNLAGLDVEISGAITNIKPEYKVKYDGKNVESFYLNVDADANLTAKVSGEFEDTRTKSKEVKIGSLPVAFGGPLTVEIGVYATVSLSGEITVSYSWGINGGVSYTENNGWRTTKNFQKKSFTLDAFGNESVSIKASVMAKFCGMKLAEMYLMVGETAHFATNIREDGTECATIRGHLFAEVGVNADLFGLKQFSHSIQFINESNSPLKITKHWENDIFVDKCKYEDINSGTTGTIVKKKKYKNYTDYEEYGIEYKDLITVSNSADSKSDGSVTKWADNIKLTEDTVVYGDLLLSTYKVIDEKGNTVTKSFSSLDLDGFTLTVYGDVIQNRGTVTINNGTLNVYGNYKMENTITNNIGEIEYNSCSASLKMQNEYDKVNISGNLTTHNLNSGYLALNYGILTVSGDIWSDDGFCSRDVNKVILNGVGSQDIYIINGYFNELEILNPTERIINFSGKMAIFKLGSNANIKSVGMSICYLDLNQYNMTIIGDVEVLYDPGAYGKIDLNGGILTINGDVLHSSGTITCNNGTLNINGNYTMEDTTINNVGEIVYNSCSAVLNMQNEYDKVKISGNLTTHNLSNSGHMNFDYGVLTISGNIWTDCGFDSSIDCSENFKFVLNGQGEQSIYAEGYSSSFSALEIINPDKRKIIFVGDMYIHKLLSDINVETTNLCVVELNLNQHNMTIDGDISVTSGTNLDQYIDLNGGILTINGDVLHSSGTITCNNGTLNINGNYTMENTTTNNVGETVYNICYAGMNMQNEYDKVNISGNLTSHNLVNYHLNLDYGVLTVSGDIWSDQCFYSDGSNKIVLNGEENQNVYLTNGYFNKIEVINPTERKIVHSGDLNINNLVSDINIKSDDLNIYKLNLNQHNMTIDGDMTITGSIDLNGGILTINGDVLHSDGTITCNNGTLNINGNYTMEDTTTNNVGEIVYNSCRAALLMHNKYDKVNISGNLTTHNPYYGSSYGLDLEYGILTVSGDIWSDGRLSVSNSYGHKTVLNGEKYQTITLNSDDKFNILELTKPMSNYTFNPYPCWRELIKCDSETTTATMATTTTSTTTEKLTTTTNITTEVSTTTSSTTTKKLTTTIKTTTEVPTTTASTTTEEPTTTINTTTEVPVVTTTISSETNPVEIVISDTTATKGEKVSISIDIENNPGVANAEFDVAFDSECLEFIDAQSGDAMADTEFSCDISEDGTLHISFIGEGKGSGTMAVLNFNVLKTPEDSKVSVTIVDDSAKITDLNGEDVEFEVVYDAESDSSAGDVNNDGEIDLKDVVLIRRFIAGGWDVELDPEDADVNNDNEVDLKDVVLIRRYIAGGWDVELA